MRLLYGPFRVVREEHTGIVVHTFLVGDAQVVDFRAMYMQCMGAEPRIHVAQQSVSDALAFGEARQVFDGAFYFDFAVGDGRIKVGRAQAEAETGRVGK